MNQQIKKFSAISVAISTLFVTGCADIHQMTDKKADTMQQNIAYYQQPPVPVQAQLVTNSNDIFISAKPRTAKRTEPLPARFNNNFELTTNSIPLVTALSMVTEKVGGIPMVIAPDILNAKQSVNTSSVQSSPAPMALPPLPGAGATQSIQTSRPSTAQQTGLMVNQVSWNGSVKGFLDYITQKTDISWKYEDGQIKVFKYETRTFELTALAGVNKKTTSLGGDSQTQANGSGSIGASGSSSSKVESLMTFDMWTSLKSSITLMLSTYGKENMSISQDLGTVVITDTPYNLSQVEEYVRKTNEKMSRQVQITWSIYEVDITNKDQIGVDWSSVWNRPGSAFDSAFSSSSGTSGLQQAGFNILRGPWTDTKFTVGALSTLGKVSFGTQIGALTLNRQPVPVQITSQEGYIAKNTSTMSTSGTAQISVEPGSLVSGMNGSITPSVDFNGQILLDVYLSLVDSKGIKSHSFGVNNFIQTPNFDSASIQQKAKLVSGQTLAIFGYEKTQDSNNKTGVGSPNNIALGGSREASSNKKTLVILITPTILQ